MSSAAEFSETDGDLKWQRIINDPRPRPALSALGDEIEKQFKTVPPAGRDRQTLRPQPLSFPWCCVSACVLFPPSSGFTVRAP
jgi:hypothetical protein